jgi:hypothetical protein
MITGIGTGVRYNVQLQHDSVGVEKYTKIKNVPRCHNKLHTPAGRTAKEPVPSDVYYKQI